MQNTTLKSAVLRLLPRVQTPAQYIGGELNSVVKDHRTGARQALPRVPRRLHARHEPSRLAGALHHHEQRPAAGRANAPSRRGSISRRCCASERLPLYSLETFTPLGEFDLVGFSLQYEVCYTNVLTMLDLGGIPLHAKDRTLDHPLVIAGGPGAQNPELLAPFIDLFVIGDGEESLPWIMETLDERSRKRGRQNRASRHARRAGRHARPWAYAPQFYEPEYHADGTLAAMNRTRSDVPREILACTIQQDFDAIPLPTKPVVPFVQTPHDRIAIEIMRGCPWQCRFCQSTVIKRPLRVRSVETIVQAALESYRNTGHNEISLLSLSTSDYPYFEELVNADARGVHAAGREHLAAEPAHQPSAPLAAEADAGRAQVGPDAGAGGGARRHARADPQADQERRSVRGLPRGVQERLAARQALFPVRPARRAAGRSRRHRRHGRDDLAHRQGSAGPLRRGDGVGVELRAQAAHAVPVERHADARIFAVGRAVPASALPAQERAASSSTTSS